VALARSLELEDRAVFFNPGWVPYVRRHDALLEADVGVSAHPGHAEARFAFRARLLDYLWTGRPVLCTRGDELADLVEARGAGFALAPGDVVGWAETILRLLDDGDLRERCRVAARALAGEMTWPRVVAPLAEFCRRPRPAPDRERRSLPSDLAALTRYGWGVGRAVLEERGFQRVRRRLLGW
jgi:glycosyltransferase involved in cell wall biosynthesis